MKSIALYILFIVFGVIVLSWLIKSILLAIGLIVCCAFLVRIIIK